jgi:uncharacterized protein YcfJ
MNKSTLTGFVIGAIVVTAAGAVAGYRVVSASRGAEVVSVTAQHRTVKTPRQECHDVQVTRTKPVKDRDRLLGTGVGAVVGGLLGHEIGGGSGKTLATVAGAAAGGYAGNKIQQKVQQGDEVLYRLDGKEHRVHMDHEPGRRIPVKDGHIVTDSGAKS